MKREILKKEEEFHDKWADSTKVQKVMVKESFTACTAPEHRIILQRLGHIKGKLLLDLGTGLGEAAVYFAKRGAKVTATDLSASMLKLVKKVADKHGVKLQYKACNVENLPFCTGSFDIVYAGNLLHHVELEKTIKESARVLKKGGIFVSWDPLAHNPAINIYRRKAMGVRTEDEHPIKMRQLGIWRKYFTKVEYETTWLFTLWIFIKYYFIDRVDPNKERYWKKILTDHKKLEWLYLPLEKLDKIVLKLMPFLKRYCWNIVVIAKK